MGSTLSENKRVCSNCGSSETYVGKKGNKYWFKDGHGGYRCFKCWNKLVGHPRNHPKRILFKGKRIHLNENPRKGQCEICGRKIGDEHLDSRGRKTVIKQTHRHHWFYLIIMPWACTEERCVPCHRDLDKN